MNTSSFHRRVAKSLFWLSGKLNAIKTPQRTYKWTGGDNVPGEDEDGFELGERMWLPCRTSIHLMETSMHWDPHCWDHWALVHDECDPVPCAICGGCICADRDFLDYH